MTPPPSTTYARLRALFEQCVDMPPGERADWLDRHATDTGLRIELELMLAADDHHAPLLRHAPADLVDRLEADAATDDEPPSLVGRRYGAFRLTGLLGRGGQGVVYRAERADGEFAQTVAVKLLNQGIHDPQQHRRFRREREILARLDHPGVARLIDGGISAEGVPYLIMDFVDGEPIDQWCAHQALGRDARLALFERLCTIVAAAHRALIVHRDLKPSNVLVTRAGEVKVLDFGIAHLLDDEHARANTLVPMMTPGYCAPEQVDGRPITLATDVHALGVLLRQLVTGVPPRVESAHAPAPTPAARGADGARHDRALAPELGWIAAKATASEPDRRYRDALELGDDVARFRSARPVLAHPPSTYYSMRKFVRRHRGGVVVTLALVLGVLSSAGVALWQAHVARAQEARALREADRAKAALARAQAVRDFVVSVFETGGAGLPPDQLPDTATLLERGRSAALAKGTQSPETRVEMLTVLGNIHLALQREDHALELMDEAVDLLQEQTPRNDEVYASTLSRRGELRARLGRMPEAMADFETALALQTARDAHALDVARTLIARGEQRAASGRETEAVADYARAVAIEDMHPDTPAALRAQTSNGYGIALWRADDCARGEPLLRKAVALSREAYGDDHMETAGALSGLSLCLTRQQKTDESEAVSRESLDILTRIFGADHPALGQSRNNLANLLIRVGKLREAEPLLRKKLAVDRLTGVDEAGSGLNTWINLSNLLRNRGDLDGALDAALTAQRIGRKVAANAAAGHEPELLLARVALAKGEPAPAQAHIDAFRRWQASAGNVQVMAPARIDFLEARIRLEAGNVAAAEPLVARALDDVEQLGCAEGARAYIVAADVRRAQGLDDDGRELLDRAVALCERLGLTHHFAYGEALLGRAQWRLRHDDRDGAASDARRAEAALSLEFAPTHPTRRQLDALKARLG